MDISAHEQRIMGLYYDNIKDVLYTGSEDKTIKTIENKECTNGIIFISFNHSLLLNLRSIVVRHSETGLTGLIGDKEFKRLFVSNKSGVVFIYSINSVIILLSLFIK